MMKETKQQIVMQTEIVIIGAGLTGLTTGLYLTRRKKDIVILEKDDRTGGQIRTYEDDGFVYESGPNTGVVSYPEVAELFEQLGDRCVFETARKESECRLIWKGDRFRELPSGLLSAVTTPLFSFTDKIRILGEPFRKRGTDPDESVAALAARRLGRSFVNYAVDPFLSGVYAGDATKLITRYALPKLYNLEQTYGSFIKGSIAKAKLPKTERDLKATKKVFSVKHGLSRLTAAITDEIGREHFVLDARGIKITPGKDGRWNIEYSKDGVQHTVSASKVVTTVGAYSLPGLLPFVSKDDMDKISRLEYAPVIQVGVGIKNIDVSRYRAFGGLVPSCENRNVLGILYPSACFNGRSPEGGMLFSFFIGGMRHPEMLSKSDDEIKDIVINDLHEMLKIGADISPDMIKIFRHHKAIPQYGAGSGERLAAVNKIMNQYKGLIIAGNLKDGIGMADRIRQATEIGTTI